MKLKTIFLCFTLLTVSTALAGLYFYYNSVRMSAFKENHIVSESSNKAINNAIAQMFSHYYRLNSSLSQYDEFSLALIKPSKKKLTRVNQILDLYNSSFKTDVCYILNSDGITIASSNYNDNDSFIGKNYSFRPYFKNTIMGTPFSYMALGVTTGKRGVYFSSPIYDLESSAILGVCVIKKNVDEIEKNLFSRHSTAYGKHNSIIAIINEDGVIFISDRKEFIFHTMWETNDSNIKRIESSRQFGKGPWPWAGFSKVGKNYVIDSVNQNYHLISSNIEEIPNWKIIHLSNTTSVLKNINKSLFKTASYIFLLAFIVLTSVLVVLNYLANKAEKTITKSENKYRFLVNTMNEGLVGVDENWKINFVNKKFIEMIGFTKEDLIGSLFHNYVCDEHKVAAKKEHEKRLQSITGSYELSLTRSDGKKIFVLCSPKPTYNKNGKYMGGLGVISDITQLKLSIKQLQKSEERFKFLAENMGDIVWTLDTDMKATYVSPSVEKILGFTPEERMQQKLEEMVTSESLNQVIALYTENLAFEKKNGAEHSKTNNQGKKKN